MRKKRRDVFLLLLLCFILVKGVCGGKRSLNEGEVQTYNRGQVSCWCALDQTADLIGNFSPIQRIRYFLINLFIYIFISLILNASDWTDLSGIKA